ncbi:MAG: carbamoyltransferase [Deltaproteobacteria bacterium]|nr:carbamoyltransferase [Deltaproteobacteria bacterium]
MARTNILGISAFYHDSAACLVTDGEIVAAAQEERFTRKKHDAGFPRKAVEFCLRQGGITSDEITHVAFYDKPWIKFERLVETYLAFAPIGFRSYAKAMPLWIKEKLWMGDLIRREVGNDKADLLYPEHHQSHAASAFYPSPFDRAAILTLDGVGEWATTSWGTGSGNQIDLRFELRFPHSLGLLYSAFTYYTGFKVNSGEYKVMGLAPYGEPKFVQLILDHVIDLKPDGSFKMNMEYFNYCQGLTMTSEKFHKLFGGPPRTAESQLGQREMDLARSVQDVTEEIMLRMARHVRKESAEKNLVLAGGVALNCVGNGKILREGIFDRIWIQPAAGDAGGALGAALFAWHQALDNPRRASNGRDTQRGSYLGPVLKNVEVETWLKSKNIPYRRYEGAETTKAVASHLAAEKVVGWFSGRMEFGPRALGARSILGDARSPKMQKVMNLKIKYRESFRPFAPACLRERVADFFEMNCESPYMLLVAPVREERRRAMTANENSLFGIEKLNVARSDIPAVTHVDYSARIQTVEREDNPAFYDLIREFEALTGYGILVNTSFNVRGEPIVCSPDDAYRCFMRTEMDVLVLEDCVLLKEEQPAVEDDGEWKKEYELD